MTALIECVPNFSEGRDARKVEAIVAAMCVEGVHLLDWSMDKVSTLPSHRVI